MFFKFLHFCFQHVLEQITELFLSRIELISSRHSEIIWQLIEGLILSFLTKDTKNPMILPLLRRSTGILFASLPSLFLFVSPPLPYSSHTLQLIYTTFHDLNAWIRLKKILWRNIHLGLHLELMVQWLTWMSKIMIIFGAFLTVTNCSFLQSQRQHHRRMKVTQDHSLY